MAQPFVTLRQNGVPPAQYPQGHYPQGNQGFQAPFHPQQQQQHPQQHLQPHPQQHPQQHPHQQHPQYNQHHPHTAQGVNTSMNTQAGPSRLVERSDIREERLTDADMREKLSDYRIYRFKKVDDDNAVDDEGNFLEPTWSNVFRTEVQDTSKQNATREVRDLDRALAAQGMSLADKKNDLKDDQQRQIEKGLEELARMETDPRYHYVLAQLDRKLERIPYEESSLARSSQFDRLASRGRDSGHSHYGGKSKGFSSKKSKDSKDSKKSSSSKKDKKDKDKDKDKDKGKIERQKEVRVYRTVTITAFYKRQPRLNVDIYALYQEKMRPLNVGPVQARPPQNMMPMPMQMPMQPQQLQNPHPHPHQQQQQQQQHPHPGNMPQHNQPQVIQPLPPRARTPAADKCPPPPPPPQVVPPLKRKTSNIKPKVVPAPKAIKAIKPALKGKPRALNYSSDSDASDVSEDWDSIDTASTRMSSVMSSDFSREKLDRGRGRRRGLGRNDSRGVSRSRTRSRSHHRNNRRNPRYRPEAFGVNPYREHVKEDYPVYGDSPVASRDKLWATAAITAPPPPPPTEYKPSPPVQPVPALVKEVYDIGKRQGELEAENRMLRDEREQARSPSLTNASTPPPPPPAPPAPSSVYGVPLPAKQGAHRTIINRGAVPQQQPQQPRVSNTNMRHYHDEDISRLSRLSLDDDHAYGEPQPQPKTQTRARPAYDHETYDDHVYESRDYGDHYPAARYFDRPSAPYAMTPARGRGPGPVRRPQVSDDDYVMSGASSWEDERRESRAARRPVSPNPFTPNRREYTYVRGH